MTKLLTLNPGWTWGDLDLTSAPFLFGFGSDLGAPQTATEALAQLLLDGEIEVGPRASNRTIEFTVYVEGESLLDLANAEAMLALEADKPRNTLTYNPGDGAPATVYDTFRAQMTFTRDDTAEQNAWRAYTVTMKASPHGRSVGSVVSPAISSGGGTGGTAPTVTTINAGTSTTGWTASSGGGAVTLSDGAIFRTYAGLPARGTGYTPSSSIDLSTTPFLSLVMSRRMTTGEYLPLNRTPTCFVNGTSGPTVQAELVQVQPLNDGFAGIRYYWRVPAGFTATGFAFGVDETEGVRMRSLQRQNTLAVSGTARQQRRTVQVAGSARTQGSLSVSHESSALGSALVYTWPSAGGSDYMPPLRSRRISGGTLTGDASLVSGARDNLDTTVVYEVPAASLIPGTHLLMARVRSDTNGNQTIGFGVTTNIGGVDLNPTTGSRVVGFGTTPTVWRNVVIARLVLPTAGVPVGSNATVRVAINATAPAASNIDLDEAWLFNTSVGEMTWVECGTGTPAAGGPSNRLWIDSATTDRPAPMVYRGTAADRSDAFYPGNVDFPSTANHEFSPPLVNVFTVTSNAENAAVSLEHFARWQTHAAS